MNTPERMTCPKCGAVMNHHADKLVERGRVPGEPSPRAEDGAILEMHACPRCGNVEARAGR